MGISCRSERRGTDEARALQTRSAEALARVALPHQRPEVLLIADW
jgi:hypothetical protein